MPLEIKNRKYTRASEIVGAQDCKLYGYYTKFPPADPRRMYTFVAARGTIIHDEISRPELSFPEVTRPQLLTAELSTPPAELIQHASLQTSLMIDKKLGIYNYKKFLEEYEIQPLMIEERLSTRIPYPISGRPDMIAKTKELELPVIIDWKYSKRKSKHHYLKELIYYHLCTQNNLKVSKTMWTVLLGGNKPKLCEYQYNHDDLLELLENYANINEPEIPNNLKIRCLICSMLPACPLYHIE
jgi:hypothetical protein